MRRSANAAKRLAESAPLFAALGDETRLRLVSHLAETGPTSIARLTSGSKVTRQAVTKHLRVLESAGLVKGKRDGRESLWELAPQRLDDARRYLDTIAAEWEGVLGRLKDFVER